MRDHASDCIALAGTSAPIQVVKKALRHLATTNTAMLLHGEPGTGKLQCAATLHRHDMRGSASFSVLPLAALSEEEAEERLFASTGREGTAVLHTGTLYLEGIETLALRLQRRLADALTRNDWWTGRVIAGSIASLEEHIRFGRFCPTLYHRLAVFQIALPPLRARREDIPDMVTGYLRRWERQPGARPRSLSPAAMDILVGYAWPGNIPELERAVYAACTTATTSLIGAERVRELLRRLPRAEAAPTVVSLVQAERDYILHVLERSGGNRSVAARRLEISRGTLLRKLKSYTRPA